MRHTATLWFLLVAISLSGHAHADNNDARVKAIHKKLAALTKELATITINAPASNSIKVVFIKRVNTTIMSRMPEIWRSRSVMRTWGKLALMLLSTSGD